MYFPRGTPCEELLLERDAALLLRLWLPDYFRRTVLHFHVSRCLLTSDLEVNLKVTFTAARRKVAFSELLFHLTCRLY